MAEPGVGRLVRGRELIGLPVVTIGGEDVAEVKDVVYDAGKGGLLGFTLNRRKFLGRPLHQVLAVAHVGSIGRDAVMIADEAALSEGEDAPQPVTEASPERDVLGAQVVTEEGRRLGQVTDVVVFCGSPPRVEGYELTADKDGPRGTHTWFLPLPDQIAVSGDALIVPDAMESFVRDDLSGFGAAVSDFRSGHGSGPRPTKSRATHETKAQSKAQLYREAQRRHIAGRSAMSKAELERALEHARD